MKAKEAYELLYVEPVRRARWIRHAFVAAIAVITMGDPVAPGGGEVQIADRFTGRILGTVDVSFGDGFTRTRLDEDLLVLSAEEFAAKWITGSGTV